MENHEPTKQEYNPHHCSFRVISIIYDFVNVWISSLIGTTRLPVNYSKYPINDAIANALVSMQDSHWYCGEAEIDQSPGNVYSVKCHAWVVYLVKFRI